MHCDLRSIVISALPEVFDSMSQKRQYYVKKMRTLLGIRYSQGNLVKLRFPVTEFIANITSHYWSANTKFSWCMASATTTAECEDGFWLNQRPVLLSFKRYILCTFFLVELIGLQCNCLRLKMPGVNQNLSLSYSDYRVSKYFLLYLEFKDINYQLIFIRNFYFHLNKWKTFNGF